MTKFGVFKGIIWGCFLTSVCLAEPLKDRNLPKTIPDEPFDLQAPRMEFTNDTIVATGGVTGRFENVMIRADKITGNQKTGDLHAEGHIVFTRGDDIWKGEKLDYNYIKQQGDFGPSTLYFDPLYLKVDSVKRISTNKFLLKGASFTTCPKKHPHIHVHADEAEMVNQNYIKGKGVTFYVGSVPVFYVPYWNHKLNQGIFTFKMGAGSEWGAFLLTKATVPLSEDVDYITDLNLYTKRGVGIGQGLEWNKPNNVGGFNAFYLKDEDPHNRFDSPLIDTDRYRFKFEELYNFSDTHYINTKWNYLSDPAVLEEFFKREYRNNAQPENYFSWVYGNSYLGTEGFVSHRLNDFYDNTDRVEYSADLYRTRLGNSPLYFSSENSVSYLDRVYSSTNITDSAYNSVRFDSANTLYLPQRYGFMNVIPRAVYRATYYSHTPGQEDSLRNIGGVGLETSFQATKVLDNEEHWFGTGLRHKIEPYADYIYEQSSLSPTAIYQFDDIDSLDDENKVQLGLRNVLQTRRKGRTSRFIDLDLYTYYFIEKNGNPNNFDGLYADARMPLTEKTMIDAEGKYNWYDEEFEYFDARISHRHEDVIFSMEYLYQRDTRSLWTPRIELYPDQKFSFEFYGRYDDNENNLEEIAGIVYANWCCMRYGLGCHFYDDDEVSIVFSIGLSAFPEAKISSGL